MENFNQPNHLKMKLDEFKGIGPKKYKALCDRGLYTMMDLLKMEPRSYEDRRTPVSIESLRDGQMAFVIGNVTAKRGGNLGYGASRGKFKVPLTVVISDGTHQLSAVFFNNNFISRSVVIGQEIGFYGQVQRNAGKISMVHPQLIEVGGKTDNRGILPVYGNFGLGQNQLRELVTEGLKDAQFIQEPLPLWVLEAKNLMPLGEALKQLHFPVSMEILREARRRLKFDEFLSFQLSMRILSSENKVENNGIVINGIKSWENLFLKALDFELTDDQKQAWQSVKADLESSKPMNRLIQGDVGSGKSVIAMLALMAAAKDGKQGAMMVPTELLAKQQFKDFKELLEPFGVEVALLCSSMGSREKKQVKEQLANGQVDVVIGTHALLQDDVSFSNLGVVVTDEQHRFGVNQRKSLHFNRERSGEMINVLLMTATPIPRTLSVVAFGNMDVTLIRQMPSGRVPIKTYVMADSKRKQAYSYLLREAKAGRQAYVVAPLIEPSEQVNTLSATEIYDKLEPVCKKHGITIGLVHGDMDQGVKEKTMTSFANGKIKILVATVVIEVGINVPNASLMIIDGAHRFGLSQLHQLRGRVGRGSIASSCIMINGGESQLCQERLDVMAKSNDGFYIAEEDLRLRGPGEIFGVRQSGQMAIDIEDLMKNQDVLQLATECASQILDLDPHLDSQDNQGLKELVTKQLGENIWLEM